MENIEFLSESKKNIEDNPDYFGAYLNMARNNLFITLGYISESVQKSFKIGEDELFEAQIIKSLIQNTEPDEVSRIIKDLEKHLPFIKFIVDDYSKSQKYQTALPEHYAYVLKILINQLNGYRNYFTHAVHPDYETNELIIPWMRLIFDAARIQVKERFNLKPIQVEHLVRCDKNGEKIAYNYAFYDNKKVTISEKGIAFFTCLFLEKKYTYIFLKKLQGFKRSNKPEFKSTMEAFSISSLRLPKVRLESDDSEMALVLDMFNELQRCPSELYDTFSEIDQRNFKVENEENYDEDGPEIVMKRHEDRFPYFALRYLDEKKGFKNLRFHIDLGTYYFKVYDKTIVGEKRIRRLSHQLKGFGKLSDFSNDKRTEEWQHLCVKTHTLTEGHKEPYITNIGAHYHFVNNNIGIRIVNNENDQWPTLDDSPKNPIANMWLSIYELPALLFYYFLTKKENIDKTEKIEEEIKKYYGKIRSFFKDIVNNKLSIEPNLKDLNEELTKRGLKINNIPSAIADFIVGKSNLSELDKCEKELLEMIKENKKLLTQLPHKKKLNNKRSGSKDYVQLKSGQLAQFLAHDMMLMQPAIDEKKGKATGLMFQILQSRIAFFSRDKDLLIETFRECNLIDSKNKHPFIEKTNYNQVNGIIDFYENYLKARLKYLENCYKKQNYSNLHFLHIGARHGNKNVDYIKNLANQFCNEPINLPRGLFMDLIVDWFRENGSDKMKSIVEASDKINTVYLIQKYFEIDLKDESQEFYSKSYGRTYNYLNTLLKKGKSKKEIYYSPEKLNAELKDIKNKIAKLPEEETLKDDDGAEVLDFDGNPIVKSPRKIGVHKLNELMQNEKRIRHIKVCDILIHLMAKDLLNKNIKELNLKESDLFLRDIKPKSETGILSKKIKFELKYELKEGTKIIYQDDLKFKNYGDFRRFLKDRRLDNLLPYFKEMRINRKVLEKELEQYDSVRPHVFKLIRDFEKEMFNKYQLELEKKINKKNQYIEHNAILEVFFEKFQGFKEKKALMENLRGKFSHNQYPDSALFKDIISTNELDLILTKGNEKKSIARQLFKIIEDTYGAFTLILNK